MGERLTRALAEVSMTAAEVSRQAGLGTNQIYRYLSGSQMPSAAALYSVAVALGVTMDSLLEAGPIVLRPVSALPVLLEHPIGRVSFGGQTQAEWSVVVRGREEPADIDVTVGG